MIFDKDISLVYLLKYPSQEMISTESEEINFNPIFVVGCPRSGTTLLGHCLGSSSQTFVGEESLFLVDMWRIYSDLFLGINKRNYNPLFGYTSEKNILKFIREFSLNIFKDALDRNNSIIYVDHTPWYGLIMLFIKSIFPNARFVHIIRRGIEVANSLNTSYKKGFLWCGNNYMEHFEMWEHFIVSIRNQATNLISKDYFEVKYEDLCDNPYDVLSKELCPFLGLEFRETMVMSFLYEHASPSRNEVIQFEKGAKGKIVKKAKNQVFQSFNGDNSLDYEYFAKRFSYLFKDLDYPING